MNNTPAPLLGEDALLLQLGARADHVVPGRQAVLQGDVLFVQRDSRGSVSRSIVVFLRGDDRLQVTDGGIERGAQAVRQRREVLIRARLSFSALSGLLDARHDVAQLGDQRVVSTR